MLIAQSWFKKSRSPIKRQFQIYYISEALSGAKLNYSKIEKIAYAVVISSRNL